MTTPDLEAMMPRSVVLTPAWNDPVASVLSEFQDPRVSVPQKRVWIPAGVSTIRVTGDVRFSATVKYLRGSSTRDLGVVSGSATFEVVTESPTEMWFEWSGTPNTNDRATTRLGVTIYPSSPA